METKDEILDKVCETLESKIQDSIYEEYWEDWEVLNEAVSCFLQKSYADIVGVEILDDLDGFSQKIDYLEQGLEDCLQILEKRTDEYYFLFDLLGKVHEWKGLYLAIAEIKRMQEDTNQK